MKRNLLLILATAMLCCFSACEEPAPVEPDVEDNGGNEDGGNNNDNPDTGEKPSATVTMPVFEGYPLECEALLAEGNDVGVTIDVIKVMDQNFVFELRPGAMVQSFKLDVYPLAQLMNNLLNDKNSGALRGNDAVDINERIREYLFNESGSGGYAFSIEDFESAEDFLQIEFDWMNTSYSTASAIAIPDCGYVIAVVGSTDTQISSSNQEQLTLCYVHTTSQPLIGDPQVEIDVNTGYRKFVVNHIPNADAAGVYYFGYLTSEIDEYIDAFGETMFRDFMRTRVTSPSPANDPDALVYSIDYGQGADSRIQSTTCAVAVDANLTPQKDFARSDFTLEEMPDEEDQPVADLTIDIVYDRVAAAYFEFDVNFSKNCQTIFYRFYNQEEKDALMNGSATDRKKEAIKLVQEGGYGCHNPNFAWDKKGGEDGKGAATGSGAKVRLDGYGGLAPGGTYYVGFTGRNGYGSVTELEFSEPVVMDVRNYDSPANCQVKDLKLWLDKPGRTSFRQNITYDPSTVSLVHVQYMTRDNNPGFWTDAPWSQWIDFIFNTGRYGNEETNYSPWVNEWITVPSGSDPFTWTGMTPNTEYTVFLCAEDFDGNISEMQFASIYTAAIQVGPDPTINMELVASDHYPYDWTVNYTIDHDVEYFLYCFTQSAADLSPFIPGLNSASLKNIKASGISYEAWRDGIYEWVAGGFEGTGGGMRTESDTSQEWEGGDVTIAACIAVGKDADSQPVYKMYHLICENGKAQTLEEIFGITE